MFRSPNPVSVQLLCTGQRPAPSSQGVQQPGEPSPVPWPWSLWPGHRVVPIISQPGHPPPWFLLTGWNSKAEKGAEVNFHPAGRDQSKALPHGPVPTTAPQGGGSPRAPPSQVLLWGFPDELGAQFSPQKPRALIPSPLPPFAADFSSLTTRPDSWVCRTPKHGAEASAPAVPGMHQEHAGAEVRSKVLPGSAASRTLSSSESCPCPWLCTVGHWGCRHQRGCFHGGWSVQGLRPGYLLPSTPPQGT